MRGLPLFEQVGGLEQASNAAALLSDLTAFLRSVFLDGTEAGDSDNTEIVVKKAHRRMKRQQDRDGENMQDNNNRNAMPQAIL